MGERVLQTSVTAAGSSGSAGADGAAGSWLRAYAHCAPSDRSDTENTSESQSLSVSLSNRNPLADLPGPFSTSIEQSEQSKIELSSRLIVIDNSPGVR